MTRSKEYRKRSLEALAQLGSPFDSMEKLVSRVELTSKEGKHLEWKQHPPIGAAVSPRSKYRTVKVVLSFANWQGGFVFFGVAPAGRWIGLERSELASVDPAAIREKVPCLSGESGGTSRGNTWRGGQGGNSGLQWQQPVAGVVP